MLGLSDLVFIDVAQDTDCATHTYDFPIPLYPKKNNPLITTRDPKNLPHKHSLVHSYVLPPLPIPRAKPKKKPPQPTPLPRKLPQNPHPRPPAPAIQARREPIPRHVDGPRVRAVEGEVEPAEQARDGEGDFREGETVHV